MDNLYAINLKAYGPALVAEFSPEQERELEIDQTIDPFGIEELRPVRVARYSREFIELPLRPEQVRCFTFSFLEDTYEMRRGEFQKIPRAGGIDQLIDLVNHISSKRPMPPKMKKVAQEVNWQKTPVNLEVRVLNEYLAELGYNFQSSSLFNLKTNVSTMSRNGLSDFVVFDETGRYQKPTKELIEAKLAQAENKAEIIRYDTRHFYDNMNVFPEFSAPELTAAINLASRDKKDISKRVIEIKEKNKLALRRSIIEQLPEIAEDLYRAVSGYLQGIGERNYNFETEVGRFLDFALSANLNDNPKLVNRVAELVVLRSMAEREEVLRRERDIQTQISDYQKQISDVERDKAEIEAKKPKVFSSSNERADDLLSRLGFKKRQISLLRRNTKPIKIEVPDEDEFLFR